MGDGPRPARPGRGAGVPGQPRRGDRLMDPNLKKTLRSLSLELRHVLEGWHDAHDAWQPGDLERRLNELGVWRDRAKDFDEVKDRLTPADREARKVVDAYLRL